MHEFVDGGLVASLAVPTVTTRRVTPQDASALMAIYNAEVLESTVTMDLVPRTLADQLSWIEHHRGIHGAVVACDDDPTTGDERILGFASISPWRSRPAYSTSVENSVYVDRDHQGRGIGRILLDEALRTAVDSGFHTCFARIMSGHVASIRLHASRGFELVGVEREVARKFGRWIDVTVMQKLL
jgi:L-amino acid N-acyltransferase